MTGRVPHHITVIAFCVAAIGGYAAFSAWAVFRSGDVAMTGDVIGTWKSFAVAAFAFWLGSSSGGKAAGASEPPPPVPPRIEIPEPTFGREPPTQGSSADTSARSG